MSGAEALARSFGSHAHSRSPLRQSIAVAAAGNGDADDAARTRERKGRTASTSAHGHAGQSSPAGLARTAARDQRRSSSSRPALSAAASMSSQARPVLTSRPVMLWVHEPPNFSKDELVMNTELIAAFGGISNTSELLEVRLPATSAYANPLANGQDGLPTRNRPGQSDATAADDARKRRRDRGIARRGFLFRASQAVGDIECIERSAGQLQLSISRNIASVFGLHNRCEVMLSKVSLADHTISHIELYFRDQYLGRADQWRLVSLLEDSCVYVGQRVTLSGCVRATVGRIFINEKKVMSGYVGPQTRAIFRSESAKYNVFIQMAQEMWDFDEDGEIYYEKALSGFLPELIERWKSASTTHVVSICLFARVFYHENELHMLQEAALPLRRESGRKERWYIDYYKVIIDLESDCDWQLALTTLKEEFFRFRHDVLLLRRPVSGPAGAPWLEEKHADLLRRDRAVLAGTLSSSHEGNVLEAINLALNPFDEHYIDRDLNRTGLDLLVLSAGTGHFDVDKRLLRLTTERLIDSGIGFDLVCLTKMPLHSVPLFHFESQVPALETLDTNLAGKRRRQPKTAAKRAPPDPLYLDDRPSTSIGSHKGSSFPFKTTGDFYSIPHWVDCSFYNLQQDKPFRADRFVPRCKMREVQMLGLMENEISDIAIPYLDLSRVAAVSRTDSGNTRIGSGRGSLTQGLSAGSSGKLNRSLNVSADGLDGAVDFDRRERNRRMREQYDNEVFRDLEQVPTSHRPKLAEPLGTSLGLPRSSSSMGSKPSSSLPVPRTPTSARRKSSVDLQESRDASISKDVPSGRERKITRDSLVASPSLASHIEHPSSDHHSNAGAAGGADSNTPSRGKDDVLTTPQTPLSPTAVSSRPTSIYSITGLGRNMRPLEPLGKAEALVASSDVEFAPIEEASADASAAASGDEGAEDKTVSKAAELMRQASTTRRVRPPPAAKSGYSWLWTTLRRSAAGRNDTSSSQADDLGSVEAGSPKQIKGLLGSTDSSLQRSNKARQHKASATQSHREQHPTPIQIPSNASHVNDETATGSRSPNRTSQDEQRQTLDEEEAKLRYAAQAQVEKQTLVNPCNPKKSIEAASTSQLMRWQHAFPRRLNQHVVKWRSMTTPACLPLTTVYLPSEADLKSQWQEHPYQFSVSSDASSFLVKRASSTPPALAILREMAAQRLAQGFQFIVPVDEGNPQRPFVPSGPNSEVRKFRLQEPWELFQPGSLSSGNPIFLSMTNQIHRILYDRASNCIHVKRFIRRTDYDTDPIQYSCCMWARNLPGYQTVAARFQYPDNAGYNWTYLDGLIAGHQEEEHLIDTTRYWRTRFVVVPSEGSPPPLKGPSGELLSDEEIRLAGMDRLADLFSRAKWQQRSAGGGRSQRRGSTAPLRFIPVSLDPAVSMRDEDFLHQVEAVHEEDHREAEMERDDRRKASGGARTFRALDSRAIVKHMYDKSGGLKINDRIWNRVMYREAFSGTDFVTWLCAEFVDISSRTDAVECGQRLLKDGTLQHVHNYHGFIDGHYFYRVKPALATAALAEIDANGKDHATGREQGHNSRIGKAVNGLQKGSRRMLMSRSIIIDADQGRRSDRAEVALLHYDLAHNPANGFNFQIHWLGMTARFIEDLVQSWTRAVERYGLRLIEAPINQIKDVSLHNPFQSPLPVTLALRTPPQSMFEHLLSSQAAADLHFEYALLRHFGFILDQEASAKYRDISRQVVIEYKSRPNHFDCSQFVHRSGVAFVQVMANGNGFLWLDNRLFNSHQAQHHTQQANHHGQRTSAQKKPSEKTSASTDKRTADSVRHDFIAFCSDAEELEAFYRAELDRLTNSKAPAHNEATASTNAP